MGPENVSCRIGQWDFGEGGQFEIVLVSFESKEHGARGVFGTIDPPHRLAMSWAWQHEGQMRGLETFLGLKFMALDDGTSELRLTHTMLPNPEMAEGHAEGWQNAFECLDTFLAD